MTFCVQNNDEQRTLVDETLKKFLRRKHLVDRVDFDPTDLSSIEEFETYFIDLNKYGLC